MGNLFVSFDDGSDPTYASATSVLLIETTGDGTGGNPCVGESVVQVAPVLPETLEELKAFAAILGWAVEYDNDGQAILYTSIVRANDSLAGLFGIHRDNPKSCKAHGDHLRSVDDDGFCNACGHQ